MDIEEELELLRREIHILTVRESLRKGNIPIAINSDINAIYHRLIFTREEYQQLELENNRLKTELRNLSEQLSELKEENEKLKLNYELELELGKKK